MSTFISPLAITPNILHQLYQGVIKHLVAWVLASYGIAEIDAHCRHLPPNHNIRLFMKGISSLSRVTGREHDQMAHILLGLVLDARLPDGISSVRLVRSIRAILDFLFLSQYPLHTSDTLKLLDDALNRFHESKAIFVDLGIREHFNLPKVHFMRHFVTSIKAFGTLDNFNTEYTERLHIDFAKDAYRATNRKDEFRQMTIWLERREKILRHDQHISWHLSGSPPPKTVDWSPPGLDLHRRLHITKHPSAMSVPLENIVHDYGATLFKLALRRYISLCNNLTRTFRTGQELDESLWNVRLPFVRLPVWHRVKFLQTDAFTGVTSTVDSIHVAPARRDRRNRYVPPRFDTALLLNDEVEAGHSSNSDLDEQQDHHGIQGLILSSTLWVTRTVDLKHPAAYRVGRIHVIFSLPENARERVITPEIDVPDHLAYVEWFTPFRDAPEPNSLLYKVSPMRDDTGGPICSIVPLSDILRSVQLFPRFGQVAPAAWTSSNVLNECDSFLVNSFTDRHLYRLLI